MQKGQGEREVDKHRTAAPLMQQQEPLQHQMLFHVAYIMPGCIRNPQIIRQHAVLARAIV